MASGSVTRRGESWRGRYRHHETGRQVQATFRRQVDAQRWLRQQLEAVDSGKWVDPRRSRVTFEQFFALWAEHQNWKYGTQRAMSLAVRGAGFRGLELRQIRKSHVQAWVHSMAVTSPERAKALAPGTIKTRFMNVRSVFRGAVGDGYLAVDPTLGVKLPRQRKREASMRIPTPAEVKAILEVADERFVALIAVCAFAGLRLGEAAALQIDDVDFLRRELHVRRQVQRVAGGEVEIRLPKYESERTIPLPDQLLALLGSHVELGHRAEWLFAGPLDHPPHQNTVGDWWRKTQAGADVTGIRLHDLRHFYASGLIAAGCDVVTVQRALGHAKASTTLETYSHLWPSAEDKTRNAATVLAEEVLVANVGSMRARGGD